MVSEDYPGQHVLWRQQPKYKTAEAKFYADTSTRGKYGKLNPRDAD